MRRMEKQEAVRLRQAGASYNEIKEKLKISKSTLSYWLREYPLSSSQLSGLQKRSQRVENFRETFRLKRKVRLESAQNRAEHMLGKLTARDLFIAGISLYWAEGYKTADTTTALANTDPAMCLFFIRWIENFGVRRTDLRIRLQLYSDMNPVKELRFWREVLKIPSSCFRKPYIKQTRSTDISYKNGFGHGTCNILYHNRPINDLVLSLVQEIRKLGS